MGLLSLEHGKAAYGSDFAMYGGAVVALAVVLAVSGPPLLRVETVAYVALGIASWTAIEYALHRFVLHGIDPFRRWHEAHHERPDALICIPTVFSAALIFALPFLPALLIVGQARRLAGATQALARAPPRRRGRPGRPRRDDGVLGSRLRQRSGGRSRSVR